MIGCGVSIGKTAARRIMSPLQRAIAAARRVGASLFAVPDNYMTLGPELSALNGQTITSSIQLGDMALVVGKSYKYSATVGKTSGSDIDIGVAGTSYGWQSSAATYVTNNGVTQVSNSFTASDTTGRSSVIFSGGATGEVTNFSVREILSDTLYQDSTGVTPVSTVGQLVGLMLDSTATVGGDSVVGGDFASAAQWSSSAGFTIGAGVLSINAGGGAITNTAGSAAVIGKTYRIEFDVTQFTSGQVKAFMGGQGGAAASAVGHYTSYVTATTTDKPQVYVTSGGTVCQVDNLVVKEITGTHATQSTTANKPTLVRGLYNLLTWSNDLTNAAWGIKSAGASVTSNSVSFTTDPYSRCLHGYTFTAGAITVSASFSAADAGKTVRIGVWDSILDGLTSGKSPSLTIPASGVVVFSISSSGGAGYIGLVGDGVSVTLTNPNVGIFLGTLTAQQILANGGIPLTTSAAGWNQTAGRHLLSFDGVNDTLTFTPAPITTQATLVWAGTINNLASYPCLFGQGTGGAQVMLGPSGAVTLSKVGAAMDVASPGGSIQNGTPFVLACTINVGGTSTIRVNGVQIGSGSQITAALTATTMARMSNGAGAGFAAGQEGFCEVSNTILSLADLQAAERAAAKSVGVTLP